MNLLLKADMALEFTEEKLCRRPDSSSNWYHGLKESITERRTTLKFILTAPAEYPFVPIQHHSSRTFGGFHRAF
jgi:hypothetical protein